MIKEKNVLDSYVHKHVQEANKIKESPAKDLSMIVVIPSYNEPDLLDSLKSLAECNKAQGSVEVIVVFNAAENADGKILNLHEESCKSCKSWTEKHSPNWLKFHFLMENDLSKKHAGVGLARKIGMDEAAQRLFDVGNAIAPIVCFDADSRCESNYLLEVESHFQNNPSISACSIYFEHPLSGSDFPKEVYEAIQYYELHLRYYKQALQFANAPFAFHTIGSSMAVRAKDYCRQGGMNKRKAGEDFYFLQKFIELGTYSEINTTTVYPSPRSSNRVPFGTGRAVAQHLSQEKNICKSYHIKSFFILKDFFGMLPVFYENQKKLPSVELLEFLGGREVFRGKIAGIKNQSSSSNAFVKRFFRWFNAFKALKFIHFLRDEYFGEMPIVEAALELEKLNGKQNLSMNLQDVLQRYRAYDKN